MLKHLKLKNFRNHANYELDLENTTILVGQNGIGKSNILEAISLLAHCRSFREDDKKNLVHAESDYANVWGDNLEIFIQKNPNLVFRAKKNGVVKKQSDFVGTLRAVVFSPETMEIVTGSPRNRRKFLDIVASQRDREYLLALIQYEKVRSERNSLLLRIRQGIASENELVFWDKELISAGQIIIDKRREIINYINLKLSALYSKISGRSDQLELRYVASVEKDFAEELRHARRREIISGHTAIGPHRDDLVFLLNHVDVASFASRGEIRSAVLALKVVEIEYLAENEKEGSILLLLDDVFSEFDKERREHLCNLIEKYQTVITTTEEEHLSACLLGRAKIVDLGASRE